MAYAGSEEGGLEELDESWFSRASRSARRAYKQRMYACTAGGRASNRSGDKAGGVMPPEGIWERLPTGHPVNGYGSAEPDPNQFGHPKQGADTIVSYRKAVESNVGQLGQAGEPDQPRFRHLGPLQEHGLEFGQVLEVFGEGE